VLVPGAISGNQAIALARCRKETCSLSLMSALRVNSGTGAEPKDHVVRGGPGRTRTCNQTVMSGKGDPENNENIDEFGDDW
jgi:hypothetical protein